MYISRGVGHLLRVRFNVRPEVTVHHLAFRLVEPRGFEPLTPTMPLWCSTN
jgi:hypothetical protein